MNYFSHFNEFFISGDYFLTRHSMLGKGRDYFADRDYFSGRDTMLSNNPQERALGHTMTEAHRVREYTKQTLSTGNVFN